MESCALITNNAPSQGSGNELIVRILLIARVKDGKVLEVSIKIFDEDCFAFQPFYKLSKATASAWVGKVCQFIQEGQDKCYAENALNEIFPALNVRAFSYENYYIDEIDNLDDHARVTAEILPFDEADAAFFAN